MRQLTDDPDRPITHLAKSGTERMEVLVERQEGEADHARAATAATFHYALAATGTVQCLIQLEEIARQDAKLIPDDFQVAAELLVGEIEWRELLASGELQEVVAKPVKGVAVGGHVGAKLEEVIADPGNFQPERVHVRRRVELDKIRAKDLKIRGGGADLVVEQGEIRPQAGR